MNGKDWEEWWVFMLVILGSLTCAIVIGYFAIIGIQAGLSW